jgi:hypothetical protein
MELPLCAHYEVLTILLESQKLNMYLLLQLATDLDLTFNLAVFHPRKKEILDRTHECFQVNQNCGVILI